MARPKIKSRPQRWAEAVKKANDALGVLADLREALEDLQSLKEEYAEWRASLPENLESSPTAEKLDNLEGIEIEEAIYQIEHIEGLVGECESADLPRGFGRD